MKKIIYFILLGAIFHVISCTRSAVDGGSAKVVFQVPTFESSHLQSAKVDNFVNNLMTTPGLRSQASSSLPTGLDGASPINCFAVMVSGPGESLQRNRCVKNKATAPVVDFKFGELSQAATFGGSIEMELDSGSDRVVRLIGLRSEKGSCAGFKDDHSGFSQPFILAEEKGILLSPGATKVIPMTMTYNAENYIDECYGPDFPPREGDGDGPGHESPSKFLAIRKDFFLENRIVENFCQSVDVVAYAENMNQHFLSQSVEFRLKVRGSVVSVYSDHQSCSNANPVLSSVTMPAQSDRKQLWFRAPYKSLGDQAMLDLEFVTNPQNLSSIPLNVFVEYENSNSFEIALPERILPNLCYGGTARAKTLLGNYTYLSGSVPVAVANGLEVYTDSNCLTPTTAVSFSYGWAAPFYVKASGSAPNPQVTFSFSGYISAVKNIKLGSGSTNLAQIEIYYFNQTTINSCSIAEMVFLNENRTVIPLPSSVGVSFSGADVVVYPLGDCMGTGLSTTVAAGATSARFNYSGVSYGQKNLTVNVSGLSPYQMSYFVDYHLRTKAVLNSVASSIPAGTCLEVSVFMEYVSGGLYYPNADVAINVSPAMNFYDNSSCAGNPLPNVVLPANQGTRLVYILADNLTSSPSSVDLSFQAPASAGAHLWFSVLPRPVLHLGWDNSLMKLPVGVVNLSLFVAPFSGMAPYTYSKSSGAGVLSADQYTSAAGDSATFNILDSGGGYQNFSTATYASVYTYDFMSASLPPGFNFYRTGTAYYFNASGVLVSAAANTPRFSHNSDPSVGHSAEGLLIEPMRTNMAYYSDNMSFWTSSLASVQSDVAVSDPTGNSFSQVVRVDARDGYNMPQIVSNMIFPNYGQTYTASVFVKKFDSRYVAMKIQEGGVVYGYSGVVVDLDTGSVVGMVDPWSSSDISANFGVQKLKNGWFRIWTNYTAKGGSNMAMYLYPSYQNGPLSPQRDYVPPIAKTYFWGAQVEDGKSMTSYIPTTSGVGTRSAESLGAQHTAFSSFVVQAERSISFEYSRPEGHREQSGVLFKMCSVTCSQNSVTLSQEGLGGYFAGLVANNGADNFPLYLPSHTARFGINKVALSFKGATDYGFSAVANTAAVSTSSGQAVTSPDFTNGGIYIGQDEYSGNKSTLYVRKIEMWNHRLARPALRSMTHH
ncbi:MAG: hypothetical protein JNL11_01465 [Bdellovibrionaceae bacterium]|nr:hypothetical protein [Pseudobdellovibrionaceae bacterium]